MHSYKYAEAEKAFVIVLDPYPECSMSYWGTSMRLLNHPLSFKQKYKSLERGEKLLKVDQKLTPNNESEKDYIDAVKVYFNYLKNLDTKFF